MPLPCCAPLTSASSCCRSPLPHYRPAGEWTAGCSATVIPLSPTKRPPPPVLTSTDKQAMQLSVSSIYNGVVVGRSGLDTALSPRAGEGGGGGHECAGWYFRVNVRVRLLRKASSTCGWGGLPDRCVGGALVSFGPLFSSAAWAGSLASLVLACPSHFRGFRALFGSTYLTHLGREGVGAVLWWQASLRVGDTIVRSAETVQSVRGGGCWPSRSIWAHRRIETSSTTQNVSNPTKSNQMPEVSGL